MPDGICGTHPTSGDFDRVITGDALLRYEGVDVGVYVNLGKSLVRPVRSVATGTKYDSTSRTSGLPTQSSVFGALPRNPLRVDYCRFSRKSSNERDHFRDAFRFAETVDELYRAHLPGPYKLHRELVDSRVHKDWRAGDYPFTTCNFNVNHAIRYHRDSGNFKGVFSNVLVLRDSCSGGELVFPEFRVALAQSDAALCLIDGQKWTHGVMPIKRHTAKAYRASIVYYALERMADCYPYKEERARFSKVRTKRARSRAGGNEAIKK